MVSRSYRCSFSYVFGRAKRQMLAWIFLACLSMQSPLLYSFLFTLSPVTLQRHSLVPKYTSFNLITFSSHSISALFSFFSLLPQSFPCPPVPSLKFMSSASLLLNHKIGYPTPSEEPWSQLHTSNFIHPEQFVCIYLWRVTHTHF